MKRLYKIIFLFVLLTFNASSVYSSNKIEENIKMKSVANPSGQITGNATVCLNAVPPIITFEVINNTNGPYTFAYTINGATQTPITTTNNKSITASQPTNVTGTFTYNLTGVKDKDNNTVDVPSTTNTVTINVLNSPASSAVIQLVDGNFWGTSTFNGNQYFTYCSSDANTNGGLFSFTTSSTNTSSTTQHVFDWGDSQSDTYTGTNLTQTFHFYQNSGIYTLKYTVVNPTGCTTVKNYAIYVGANPTVSLNTGGTPALCSPGSVTYDILPGGQNSPNTVYTFQVNDGRPAVIFNHPPPATYTHNYTITSCGTSSTLNGTSYPNSFQASITASNPCGTSSSAFGPINIQSPPDANFTRTPSNNTICKGTTVLFNNTTTGGFNIGAAPTYTCTSAYRKYWVITGPSGNIPVNNDGTLIPNAFISASENFGYNNSKPNNSAAWLSTASDQLNITFNTPGIYTIKLFTGSNTCGITSESQTICVNPEVIADFTLSPTTGCMPTSVQLDNLSSLPGCSNTNRYNWQVTPSNPDNCPSTTTPGWSFTSGNASAFEPEITFTSPGVYTVQLTTTLENAVAGALCQPDVKTKSITIKGKPTTTLTEQTICEGTPLTLNPTVYNCYATQAVTYLWDFGSTPPTSITSTTAANPTVTFATAGTYNYTVTLTNECGSNVFSSKIIVNPAVQISASGPIATCINTAIQLTGSISGGTTIGTWTASVTGGSFSPNSATFSPTYTPPLNFIGTILLTLTSADPSGPCPSKVTSVSVEFNAQATAEAGTYNPVCKNGSLQLNGTVGGAASTGSWTSNNGGTFSDANSLTSTYTPPAGFTGTITLTLITNDPSGPCNPATDTVIITVIPTPTINTINNVVVCASGTVGPINFSGTNATNYTWTNDNTAIGLGASGTNAISFTSTNTGTSPISGLITVTPYNTSGATSCPGTPITFTITINPKGQVNPIVSQVVCNGDTVAIAAFSTLNTGGTTTYSWTSSNTALGLATSGTGNIGSFTATNTSTAPITATVTVIPTVSYGSVSCVGISKTFTITVNPTAQVNQPIDQVFCAGTNTSAISFSTENTVGTTTYNWTNNTAGIGIGTSGIGTIPVFTPINNTTSPITATITVTPTFSNGGTNCTGPAKIFTITINPKGQVNTISNTKVCNGNNISTISFTTNNTGGTTTYTWTNNTPSIGIGTSGSGDIPSFTALNSGTTPIIATITVTPSFTNTNSCSGTPIAFTITINPSAQVNTISNKTFCNNDSLTAINFGTTNTGGTTTYSWTNNTASIGLGTSGNGNIVAFTATNTGTSPVTANIVVTPSYTNNGITCSGDPTTFTITVNPTPTVNQPSNQTVCNGQSTTAILFSGAIPNTTYNWTNSNSNIGLGANGVGDISIFTAINNGTTPIVANITVTPNLNGCPGTPLTISITINPSPVVTFTPSNQTICSGSNSALVTLSSIPGTTFKWNAAQPNGITGVSPNGTTTIPVQTLINSTNIPIVVTYLATAETNSGIICQGIPYAYTITVNPVPSITSTQAQTICSNIAFSIVPSDGVGNIVPVGTTYSWSAPVVTGGITGGAALANQTTIKGTLVNPTKDVQTATYTITPKSGTCTGPSFTAVVTVNPSPKVQFSAANQTVCSGSDTLPITLSTLTTGNVTFNWTATIPAGITGATASGTGTIATQTLINLSSNPLTVIYTATATFENNGISCSGQPLDYKITVNPAIITSSVLSNFNGFNVSTFGASDGAINVTVTGGSGSYTYLWSGPSGFSASSQDISLVPAGAYTLTINDGLCNPILLNFTLTAPLPLLIQEDTAAQIDVLCFGYLTGAIKVDITQQSVGPYDYLLTLQGGGTINSIVDSAATTYTFTGLGAGIYDIKITDANGSVKTISGIVITEPNGITASTTQTKVSCAGSATGSATVTASGGIGTLTYSWNTNPIQTTATASGLKAGTYTVTITDENTCSIQKQVVITEPNAIVTTVTSQTDVLCFGNSTGSATVSATGGTGVLNYSWDTVPIQTTATAMGLVAGTYNVTLTDANGCSKVQTVLITQPSSGLTAMISNSTNVSCFGGNNGNATVSAAGGTSPYSYSWGTSPVQTSATATGLTEGLYNVTVTDANRCTTSTAVTITEPSGISATITAQTNVFCSGNSTGSATVTATGGTAPFSYSWNTTPIQTSDVALNLPKGTYVVTVSDAKGCATTTQVTITEPNGIVTAIASQTNVNCFGNNTGAVTVLASGGTGILTYSWDTIPVQTSLNATGLIAGTYHLTVTDANNCSKIQTVTILQPDDISIITDLEKDITCFNAANGEIKITITGGTLNYNYSWTKDGISYATTDDISNLSPGIYKVTVSDANNCNPKTATFTITEPPVLAVSLTSQTNILCYGESTGAVEIAVVGGTFALSDYNFAWTGPNGFTSSNKNLVAIIAGTYTVQVTDNSGCFKALSVTLTQPTAIVLSATTTPIICYRSNDASITLTINGGVTPYTIVWSNLGGGRFQDNLSAGDYLITVTDSNNCVKTLNVNIPEAPIFTINPVVKNISCFGAQDGSINLNIIGGIAPVKLVWDDSTVAGNVRNNLAPGSYTVTIVDSKPCTIKKTFIIIEPQPLILSANTTNAFDCDNANSGAINLLVAGGTPPFSYSWSNGSTTEDLVNIPAGNYLVTVMDSRGCSKQAQYSINRQPPIVIGVATKTEFNCETKFVKQTFVAQVSGGIPPYQLAWSNGTVSGPNNEIMNTSQNGTAILYVTDALGCKANYSFNVKLQSLGTPSFNVTSYSYVTYGSYSIMDPIQFTNTATGDYISIVWDFGDGSFSTDLNPVHTFINPKEYTVTQTVTYPFGCIYVQKISFIVEKGYVLVVPTAFTPNNDTVNDTFRPVTKALKNVRLDIYDTWGSMIYSETGDTLKGWDGKIKDQNAENGNYYCKVSAETFYGTIVAKNQPFILIK